MGSPSRGHGAFTLVEALAVAAVLGILASIGYVSVTSLNEATRVEKLHNDVAVINAAIQTYQVNGGTLPNSTDAQTIVDQLKTAATADTATKIAGVRGEMVDKRLKAESGTSGERAFFNATSQRFEVKTTGGSGVVRFLLDDALATTDYGTEARDPSIDLAANGWVWNYTDRTPPARPAAPSGPGAGTAAGSDPSADQAQPLSPPTFSPPDGTYPLTNYPETVSISNPNPGGASKILYSLNGSPEAVYTGPISDIDPTDSLTARAVSVDPDHYTDSSPASSAYTADPYQLEVSVTPAAATLTYAEAGGAYPGQSPQTPAPTVATISNLTAVNAKYYSLASIEMRWTYDGADPLAGDVPPGQTGTSPASIDVSIGHWGAQSALTIKAAAVAPAPSGGVTFLSGSGSASIGISKTALASPTIDPPTGRRSADLFVTISPGGSAYPAGYGIYYTLDGSDPGISSGGQPTSPSATLYSAPFQPGAGEAVLLTSRAYGPAGYEAWFTPSPTAAVLYTGSGSVAGVLVSKVDKLNGLINGSVQLLTASNFQWNGSTTLNGDLYLVGSPGIGGNLVRNDPSALHVFAGPTSDSPAYVYSANYYGNNNPGLIPPTGSPTYTFTIDDGAISGNIYTQNTPNTDGLSELDSIYLNAVATGDNSQVPVIPISDTINDVGVQNGNSDVTLAAGDYGSITIGGTLRLGSPGTVTYYNFNSLTVNGSGQIILQGPVVISLRSGGDLNNVVGTNAHPDWLSIYSQGTLKLNGGGGIFGNKIVTNSSLNINGFVTLVEGTIARDVTVEGGGKLSVGVFVPSGE